MKIYIIRCIIFFLVPFVVFSCIDNNEINDPRGDKTVPDVPEEIVVENISGGAVIKYKLNHTVSNIRYVKAEVSDGKSDIRYFHSSQGVDSILIDGLISTESYNVQLSSYSYADVASKSIEVQITPEQSPIEMAKIVELRAAFSSVRVFYDNPTEDKLFIGLVKKINGHWQQMGMPYATQKSGSVYIQKQDTVAGEFGAYFYDKWGHRTEMVTATLTPMVEYLVDKSEMEYIQFPTDAVGRSDGAQPSVMWDGFTTKTAMRDLWWPWITVPSWISIDLGRSYILSSMSIWNRFSAPFSLGSPREFEIWGSNNPNMDEEALPSGQQQIMDPSWFFVGSFETTKPSGSSGQTQGDLDFARAGFHFILPPEYETDVPNSQEIRYVRLYVKNTWYKPLESLRISELSFWGVPVNK